MSIIRETSHQLVVIEEGRKCSLCGRSWKHSPSYPCPGVPHLLWEQVPENLKSATGLRQLKLKPAGPPRAVCYSRRQSWVPLYDVAESAARPTATPAQLAALERGRATSAANKALTIENEYLAEEQRRYNDQLSAGCWASKLLANQGWVVLDLETTGLDYDSEIVQIAIVNGAGDILLDSLVQPPISIPTAATDVHGIKDADVVDAPTFEEIYPRLASVLTGQLVVAYNVGFDASVLAHSCRSRGLIFPVPEDWDDAMEEYAAYVNDWSEYWGSYRWHPLCGDHNAAGDCLAVLRLMRNMAAWYYDQITLPPRPRL